MCKSCSCTCDNSSYIRSLQREEYRLTEELKKVKRKINSEQMRQREQSRFWTQKNAPLDVQAAMALIGHYLDRLEFDEQPLRICLGRSQFKFVSREAK